MREQAYGSNITLAVSAEFHGLVSALRFGKLFEQSDVSRR
jgi:hypothetical protein